MTTLRLTLRPAAGTPKPIEVSVDRVTLAGYTGRDREAVRAHVRELQALGVAAPDRVPAFFDVPPELLTTDSRIEARDTQTSGEAEYVLVPSAAGLLVAVASDHTDRRHEAVDVAESKRLCSKVLSREAWLHSDVQDHWDRLELRSFTTDDRGRRLYQEGRLASMLDASALQSALEAAGLPSGPGSVVFSGTIPVLEGFVYGRRFEAELRDPVLGRTLSCAYDVAVSRAGEP